ncbi:hypothetical protein EOL96_02555 [Candidatus Saccharibacteria bacterium]|nr:hypothetical protein [Candidatus Saccharibacteria bacterium]
MISKGELHKTQSAILYTLQYATRARYSELQHAAHMESDVFKFHVRKLRRVGYIVKADDGLYELTAEGKALASRLDKQTGREIEQPKSSMLMVVRCGDLVLGHCRNREPFNGFWGIASAPVLRGVPVAESAQRELKKQTGIDAVFRVAGSYRVIDTNRSGVVYEDKIFAVLVADINSPTKPHAWSGGHSEWMDVPTLLSKHKIFPTTDATLRMIARGETFREDVCVYSGHEY